MLDSPLNFLLLGSAGDTLRLPHSLADRLRIFSVDAIAPGQDQSFIRIADIIAPQSTPVTFVERASSGCSSILPPKERLVDAYKLHTFFEVKNRLETTAISLADLSSRHGVDRWHFLKTDVEGLDFGVVKSIGNGIRGTLALKMELRFEPFYEGEPHFHEVAQYLHGHGFGLLDLRVERWRYSTPHWLSSTRGRAVYCDAFFVNERLSSSKDILVQALILGSLGYVNYAEHVLQPLRQDEPEAADELIDFLFSQTREHPAMVPHPGLPHVVNGAED